MIPARNDSIPNGQRRLSAPAETKLGPTETAAAPPTRARAPVSDASFREPARPALHSTAPRTRIKKAPAETPRARRSVLGWGDVLRPLQRDEARSVALSLYRARGYSPDDFGRVRAARGAMADALSRTEDWLEIEHPRCETERAAVRRVRRALEQELWP